MYKHTMAQIWLAVSVFTFAIGTITGDPSLTLQSFEYFDICPVGDYMEDNVGYIQATVIVAGADDQHDLNKFSSPLYQTYTPAVETNDPSNATYVITLCQVLNTSCQAHGDTTPYNFELDNDRRFQCFCTNDGTGTGYSMTIRWRPNLLHSEFKLRMAWEGKLHPVTQLLPYIYLYVGDVKRVSNETCPDTGCQLSDTEMTGCIAGLSVGLLLIGIGLGTLIFQDAIKVNPKKTAEVLIGVVTLLCIASVILTLGIWQATDCKISEVAIALTLVGCIVLVCGVGLIIWRFCKSKIDQDPTSFSSKRTANAESGGTKRNGDLPPLKNASAPPISQAENYTTPDTPGQTEGATAKGTPQQTNGGGGVGGGGKDSVRYQNAQDLKKKEG